MICAYCARPRQDATACRGCGASIFVEPPAEPWEQGTPFNYNGCLVKVDRARALDQTVIAFWRGTEYLGEVVIDALEMLNWLPGVDYLPEVIERFIRETGVDLPLSEKRTFRLEEAWPLRLEAWR